MSDLRKRFEDETGKKIEITAYFDCENSECDSDMPVDIWNNEYVMWLENLANGENEKNEKALPIADVTYSVQHGLNCKKATHKGSGYLHGSDDDTPYGVDGVEYCGRCHVVL